MLKVAAVVILYNPNNDVINNISSYLNQVDHIYLIDNSENSSFIFHDSKASIIRNNQNIGIAKALNIGINHAIKNGYTWVLTFDQDSYATGTMIKELINCQHDNKDAAIISPFHANKYALKPKSTAPYEDVLTIMTSGNLLNTKIFQDIGGFTEELFIDYVDNDFCLRLNTLGYRVIQANKAILNHNLGELTRHKLLWKSYYATNHNPIRRYYMFRNRYYIVFKYMKYFPRYALFETSRFFVDFMIVLIYEKQKTQKIKMMLQGIKDALLNRYGKYDV